MTYHEPDLSQLSHSLVWAGFRQLIPVSLFVAIFGAAFGLAASQKGMDQMSATMMSVLVFAGYAQFAALELWTSHVPVVTLIATVFAINARHLLMGATLYPWLRSLTPAKRYGIMMVVSDANWAMSIQAFSRGRAGLGLLFGGGLALWLFWGTRNHSRTLFRECYTGSLKLWYGYCHGVFSPFYGVRRGKKPEDVYYLGRSGRCFADSV